MVRLMETMGSAHTLSIKRSVSIGTMLNFDSVGYGHGDGTCKQTFSPGTNTRLSCTKYKHTFTCFYSNTKEALQFICRILKNVCYCV